MCTSTLEIGLVCVQLKTWVSHECAPSVAIQGIAVLCFDVLESLVDINTLMPIPCRHFRSAGLVSALVKQAA